MVTGLLIPRRGLDGYPGGVEKQKNYQDITCLFLALAFLPSWPFVPQFQLDRLEPNDPKKTEATCDKTLFSKWTTFQSRSIGLFSKGNTDNRPARISNIQECSDKYAGPSPAMHNCLIDSLLDNSAPTDNLRPAFLKTRSSESRAPEPFSRTSILELARSDKSSEGISVRGC